MAVTDTLKYLRSLVQNKLNSVGSEAIFQPGEIDANINSGILHVAYHGEPDLIKRNLYKAANININGGFAAKPDDFFRFVYARVDSRRAIMVSPEMLDDIIYNSTLQPGNKNKYIVDYDGQNFQVYPQESNAMELHYIATINLLQNDGDESPLTNIGNRYAVDWAFALCLESKGFQPDIAQAVFNRVEGILLAAKK